MTKEQLKALKARMAEEQTLAGKSRDRARALGRLKLALCYTVERETWNRALAMLEKAEKGEL